MSYIIMTNNRDINTNKSMEKYTKYVSLDYNTF